MRLFIRTILCLVFAIGYLLPASALTPIAPENRVGEIFSIGYDAETTEATDLESRTETSTSDYDSAPIRGAYTGEIPTEANRALFGQIAEFKAAEDGIIYLRTDSQGGEYVGQAINDARYAARQAEHAAANPTEAYTFQELERVPANSGRSLDVAEEDWIRAGGGPQATGGTLQNARHQISDFNYQQAGGTISYP